MTPLIPYSPLAPAFRFTPLPAQFLVFIAGIVVTYVATAELAKRVFYRYASIDGER